MDDHGPEPTGVLIADAGGTKVDWAFCARDGWRYFRTKGIHPYFQDAASIHSSLMEEKEKFDPDPEEVLWVHFYGAGCSSTNRKQRVEEGVKAFFRNAAIDVEHDLLGAARAVSGREEGLVAILGTGSNACSYDGVRILEQSGGLGFILGDEGSGSHLGKLVLRDHLNGDLPKDLEHRFQKRYAESADRMIDEVYGGGAPSRYLASFTYFLKEEEGHEWVRELVEGAFREFLQRHVLRLRGKNEDLLHSVGSIGLHFRSYLEKVLQEEGMKSGSVIADKGVIMGLVNFHHPNGGA